jgi:hypothetical protein
LTRQQRLNEMQDAQPFKLTETFDRRHNGKWVAAWIAFFTARGWYVTRLLPVGEFLRVEMTK